MLSRVLVKANLEKALSRVKSNKGASGVDGMRVEDLSSYLCSNWRSLRTELMSGIYKPSAVKKVEIPKPNGGKRMLGIPTVLDRFIQQSTAQYLSYIYDKGFSESSYGFRPKRSAHQAVKQACKYLNMGYTYVIEIDLEKFFDVVNHDRLMSTLRRGKHDANLLKLIESYLKTGVLEDGKIEQRSKGTPQGSPLSPLLSNIILDELDKELESRGHKFVRYADDLSIYVRSKKSADRVKASIFRFIEEKLKLKVNMEKSKISRPSQSTLLGFSFYKNAQGWQIRIAKKIYHRFKTRVRELTSKNWSVNMGERLRRLRLFTRGWISYFRIAKCRSHLRSLDSWIRFRLRMCIWTTWKRVRTRIANLVKLGKSKFYAFMHGNTRKGSCRTAHSPILMTTLTNDYLANLGYAGLERMYLKRHV